MSRVKVILVITSNEIRCSFLKWHKEIVFKEKISWFDREGMPDMDRLAYSLKRFMAKHFPKEKLNACILIPFYQGYLHLFSLPYMNKRDRDLAVRYLMEEEVPLPMEDRVVDYYVWSEKKHQSLQIVVGAIKKSLLTRYIEVFQKARINILTIDFYLSALGRALILNELPNVLYLMEEGQLCTVIYFNQGIPELVRAFPMNQQGLTVEKVKDELHKTLIRYGFNRIKPSVCISESGHPWLIKLKETLTANKLIEKPDESKDYSVNLWNALAPNKRLNLYLKFQKSEERHYWKKGFISVSAVLLACTFLSWYIPNLAAEKLEREVRIWAEEGEKALQVYKLQEERMREKIGKKLSEIISIPRVKIEEVRYGESGLIIKGKSSSSEGIFKTMASLKEWGWENIVLENYRQVQGLEIDFTISGKAFNHSVEEKNSD